MRIACPSVRVETRTSDAFLPTHRGETRTERLAARCTQLVQRERHTKGGEREIDEKRRVKVWALAGGQHEECGGQKQSAQSRDSLNRSQYKETALLDTTP